MAKLVLDLVWIPVLLPYYKMSFEMQRLNLQLDSKVS